MNEKDYIRTFSYLFLKKYREKTGTDSSGVLFNKYMTLLNRALLYKGVDMHLPHCWYRWGDEVVRYCLPFIDWNHDDPKYKTNGFNLIQAILGILKVNFKKPH